MARRLWTDIASVILALLGPSVAMAQQPATIHVTHLPNTSDYLYYPTEIGDLDGDGYSEIVLGEEGSDAHVVSTMTGVVLRTHSLSAYEAPTILALGDVDADSVPDYAIANEFAGSRGPNGRTYGTCAVYSGIDGASIWTVSGDMSVGTQLGSGLARVDDIDGDGVAEIAVSVPFDATTQDNKGHVDVLSGRTGTLIYSVFDPSLFWFGRGLDRIDDLDGDGVSDLLVSGSTAGDFQVAIVSGATGSLIRRDTQPIESQWKIVTVGDLDGDQFEDYAIGDEGVGGCTDGEVLVRSGATGQLLYSLNPEGCDHGFGTPLRIGDITEDGVPDIAVHAGAYDSASYHGALFFFCGATGDALFHYEGESAQEYYGPAARIDDINGDGFDDFAIVSPSHFRIDFASLKPLTLSADTVTVEANGWPADVTYTYQSDGTLAETSAFLFSSASGTMPGVDVDTGIHLALNFGPYWNVLTALITPSGATLDGQGKATFVLAFPPVLPQYSGLRLHVAGLGLGANGAILAASNPLPITFL